MYLVYNFVLRLCYDYDYPTRSEVGCDGTPAFEEVPPIPIKICRKGINSKDQERGYE